MKKISSLALTIILFFVLGIVPCFAAKRVVAVEPLQNVAGTEGARSLPVLREHIVTAVAGSAAYRVKTSTEAAAQYILTATVTDFSVYDSKSDKAKVRSLIKKAFGNANTDDSSAVGNEEREKAAKELKEISDNPTSSKITVDVNFADDKGSIIFADTFTGDKAGATEEKAIYNACRDLATQIAVEMDASLNAAPQQTEEAADTDEDDDAVAPPKVVTPAAAAAPAPKNFRGTIGDMSDDIVYIDKGTASGLKVGDTLAVLRENGDVVINGEIVGKKEQVIGKVTVVEVLDKYSVGKISDSTAEIKKGDIVKRAAR